MEIKTQISIFIPLILKTKQKWNKLSFLILFAFSVFSITSCIKNEEASNTNTTLPITPATPLTTEQKVELISNYYWLTTKPQKNTSAGLKTANTQDCSVFNRIYFLIQEDESEPGKYFGSIFDDVSTWDSESSECRNIVTETECTYDPVTNTLTQKIDSDIIVTTETLTLNGKIYYRGELKNKV